MKKRLLVLIMAAMLVFVACSDDAEKTNASPSQPAQTVAGSTDDNGGGLSGSENVDRRDYYTRARGGGDDVFTLMVYMCGSDLESESGAATLDINEMLYAELGDKLNVIVETGGASEWQNSVIPSDTNGYWQITEDGLEPLYNAGLQDMTDPDTLAEFINYCAEEYPADRYGLILWDHGGGTVGGFAVDENFPDSEPMGVIEMNAALQASGLKFDFIGFDACLMATAETAFMLDTYADYMVASQRVEPGTGWYYTDWLTALGSDTSMDTLELGSRIADSFIDNTDGYYADELTLSVLDLTYIRDLFASMDEFFTSAEAAMVDGDFVQMSKARYDSRDLTGNYEQVDIAYLVQNMGDDLEAAGEVMDDLDNCVAYNAVSDALDNHNGLCLYFPYTELDKVENAVEIYETIGISEGYQNFIKSFSTLMVGGQVYNQGGSGDPSGESYDEDYWLGQSWLDTALIDDYEENYSSDSTIDELYVDEKGDDFVLILTDEEWDLIVAQELVVYLDVEGGSIGLGSDNVYQFDDDGDLLIEFDYTWVALDGVIVPFYAEEDYDDGDVWYSFGYVPCYVNGSWAEVEVIWDSDNPYGYVAGYRFAHNDVYQKGLIPFKDGDLLEFVFEYYDEDDYYVEEGYPGGELIVDGEIEVSYDDIGDYDCEIYYILYDIYQNTYWTESIFYS